MVEIFHAYSNSDLTLVVDGRILQVNKDVLQRESPVKFMVMLEEEGCTEPEQRLELSPPQGITYEDIVQVLNCVNPDVKQPMTVQNVLRILPVAEYFGMENRKKKCSSIIKQHLVSALDKQFSLDTGVLVQYLIICEKYSDISCLDKAIKLASRLDFDNLDAHPLFSSVSDEIKDKIQREVTN